MDNEWISIHVISRYYNLFIISRKFRNEFHLTSDKREENVKVR